ncbi:uncharacterized protein LOC111903398 [Lactuca sativa]|uniref:START domain-containing protein n=1 Tax=Lactuca sativa TaxID=4236 RepID=A0A9R1UQ40_LACSA|nr:uncharacterized protein LOC111903398 [Lactuca sativa]KAJ0191398.1 hypothetical protein LSAT_V11C800390340 [Lactuca sativa]
MLVVEVFWEILKRPTLGEIVREMLMILGPVGIAFFLGVMIGWAWKPRWANLGNCEIDSLVSSSPPLSLMPSTLKNQDFGSKSNQSLQHPSSVNMDRNVVEGPTTLLLSSNPNCSSSIAKKDENRLLLTDEDLKHLWHLVEKKDGGPQWKHMMNRSTPSMQYQAWQRDPETGPPQYCSKTVYENATPELMRDFFWDDEFRFKWDDMLSHAAILEEFPNSGTSVVHWIRKFPFFCSDREYTIGRRIWELERSYYCVTKGVPIPWVPRKQKPRRVDLYYSSWFIQSVESKCEVTFFHHEDMGISWEIAKFGVRQGMWGAARKVERGFRLYQQERAFSKTISLHVVMDQMSTKIDEKYLASLESEEEEEEDDEVADMAETTTKVAEVVGMKVPKLLLFGGVVMVACSIDRGLFSKAVIFGVAKRFGSIGRQVGPQR